MAYPTVDRPYGLKPVNLIGGQVFAGATRQIPITTASVNYNTAIFNGDVVQLDTSGCVIVSTLAAQTTVTVNGVIGVFLGCSYTNPATKQKVFQQYWPGYASGVTDAVAYVCEDPDTVFQVAAVSSGTTVAFYGQSIVGNNVSLILNTGSTTTGDSAIAISGASAVTTLLPMRVIAGVPDTANSAGNFCEFLVKFNFGYHSYYNQTGA